MAGIGTLTFHPQADFSEDERREVRSRLKMSLKGELGYSPIEHIHDQGRGYVIRCLDRHGRRVKTWTGSLRQVFDFEVTRPPPKSGKRW